MELTKADALNYVRELSCDGFAPSMANYERERAQDWPSAEEILEVAGFASWANMLAAINLESDAAGWDSGGYAVDRDDDLFWMPSNSYLHSVMEMREQEKYW